MEAGSEWSREGEWATFGKTQFTVFAPYGTHVRKTYRRATYFSIMNIAQASQASSLASASTASSSALIFGIDASIAAGSNARQPLVRIAELVELEPAPLHEAKE